jgi:predicted protein tyrosine phosphatase
MNVLFVCSRNKWRSRTAESIFKDNQDHEFKSAGTENDARIKVNEKLINWADLIFVMEKRHKQRLQDRFDQLLRDKKIVILDVEDNYQYMDEELIETLRISVTPYLYGLVNKNCLQQQICAISVLLLDLKGKLQRRICKRYAQCRAGQFYLQI